MLVSENAVKIEIAKQRDPTEHGRAVSSCDFARRQGKSRACRLLNRFPSQGQEIDAHCAPYFTPFVLLIIVRYLDYGPPSLLAKETKVKNNETTDNSQHEKHP